MDCSNPNLAMKAKWPSTALWRRLVMLGARVAPEFGEEPMAEMPDPEIRALQKVSYAKRFARQQCVFPPSSRVAQGWKPQLNDDILGRVSVSHSMPLR